MKPDHPGSPALIRPSAQQVAVGRQLEEYRPLHELADAESGSRILLPVGADLPRAGNVRCAMGRPDVP